MGDDYFYAPHPNVGKLFIDFSLSEEGQKILRGFGRSSARKGIEPDDLQKKGVEETQRISCMPATCGGVFQEQ